MAAAIVVPQFNGSAFRGIRRDSADIAFFEIAGGEANALDDLPLSYVPLQPVPLPGSLALALGGATYLATRRRRRGPPARA